MMTDPLSVRIRSTETAQQALLMLAHEIDALRAQVAALQPHAPAELLEWGPQRVADLPKIDHGQPRASKLEVLEAKRNAATDPEDIRALEAQIRLAQEDGVVVDSVGGPAPKAESEDGTIDVPPASRERIAERMQYAAEHRFVDYLMNAEVIKQGHGEAEWLAWFGKVGPKGLYISDRLAICQMPAACRRWLVEDIAQDDEAYAQVMGGDVLKSEESMDRDLAKELLEPTFKS
jgi:hypothetical protein